MKATTEASQEFIPSKVPDLRGVPLEELGRGGDGAAFSSAI